MTFSINATLITLFILQFSPTIKAEDRVLANIFATHSLTGTMVISSLNNDRVYRYNKERANQPFTVASTFKIVNTLIGLEEGVVKDKEAIFHWDGHKYDYAAWNHDQTLESAYKVSCVWCYQQLARRVGADTYRRNIKTLGYGELTEPFDVTMFWLDGSLTMSASEQVDFLKKVYHRTLPFSASAFNTLQQIMVAEKTDSYTIRAKSGWATSSTPGIGWYVGYVETTDDVWFFATNIDVSDNSVLPLRQEIVTEAFQALGIIN